LLIRLVTNGKKLFLWHDILVLIDRRLLSEGSVCEWGGKNQPQSSLLEVYRSWRDGRMQQDGDGRGEDRLNDGGVEVHHHCTWQVEFLQLPQEEHPQLPLEVRGDDSSQEVERLHSVNCGVTEGDDDR